MNPIWTFLESRFNFLESFDRYKFNLNSRKFRAIEEKIYPIEMMKLES